jgi:hypothetical protein
VALSGKKYLENGGALSPIVTNRPSTLVFPRLVADANNIDKRSTKPVLHTGNRSRTGLSAT